MSLVKLNTINKTGRLTNHKEGGIKEVLQVSYPLMISYLSGYLMLFIDRLILARYSNEAMNTVATVGTVCYVFDYGLIGVTAIVEVLVGRLNGSGQLDRLGEPVWQAIWLCIFSFALCIPLAFWGDQFLVPTIYKELGTKYYFISMLCCPFFGLAAAFGSFFIGQGKGFLVTIAVIVSNLVNLVLSLMLVFGFWILPRLGPQGAAIATGCAQIIQVVILAVIFFSKTNRIKHGCGIWKFNHKIFKEILNLGLPNSLSHVLEISAWALVANMLAAISNEQVTLFSIGQSLFILVAFFSEGLQKGVMAISSNFVGAKSYYLIPKNLASASYVHLMFCLFLLFLLLIDQNIIVKIFFSNDVLSVADLEMSSLLDKIRVNCFWVLLYFALDGLVWIRSAVLTSFGDMKFIMFANVISVIVFAVLPIYVFIVKEYNPAIISSWQLVSMPAWQLVSMSAVVNLLVFSYRSQYKYKMINSLC